MKRHLWAGGLSLSLGWLLATAAAADDGRPVQFAETYDRPTLRVGLGRPEPAAAERPAPDAQVIQAAYHASPLGRPQPVVRAQDGDLGLQPPPPAPPEQSAFKPPPVEWLPTGFADQPRPATWPVYSPDEAVGTGGVAVEGYGESGGLTCCAPDCCDVPRFYLRGEYLAWQLRESTVVPLVSTGPTSMLGGLANRVNDRTPGVNGILGPGTVVLFGGDMLDDEMRSGARFTAGYWFGCCRRWAIEASGFFFDERATRFSAMSDMMGNPVLARPFLSANTGGEFRQLVSFPGVQRGRIDVDASSNFWGAEANLRRVLCCGCCGRLDLLFGPRFLGLEDDLTVRENNTTLIDAQFPPPLGQPPFTVVNGQLVGLVPRGTNFMIFDTFSSRNLFYGGQVGLGGELRKGRWSLELTGKIALGANRQTVDILGGQLVTQPNGRQDAFTGGLLALPGAFLNGVPVNGNIGRFSRSHFSAVPEVNLTVGCQLTDHLRAFVGYNFLFWSNVARAGDQIDRTLNENLIPNFSTSAPPSTASRPAPVVRHNGFFAHGLTAGLEFRY